MIVNYDKESDIWSSIFGTNKQNTSPSQDVLNLFEEVKKAVPSSGNTIINWDYFIDKTNLADESFKNFVKTTDASEVNLENYQSYLDKTSKSTSKFSSFTSKAGSLLKSFGAGLANMGMGMLAGLAINGAFTLLDNIVNYQDKLIEKGEQAKSTIDETMGSFTDSKTSLDDLGKSLSSNADNIKNTGDAIDSIAKKYVELSNGVSKLNNENKSLSTDEYQSYLDISNQLAEQFPSLVSGYDAQGNAILNLGDNADIAATSLQKLYDAQMLSAHVDVGENIDDVYDGAMAQVDKYESQIKDFQNAIEQYEIQLKDAQTQNDTDRIDSISDSINDFRERISSTSRLIKEEYTELASYAQQYLSTSKEFTDIDQTLQNALWENLQSMDYSLVQEEYAGDFKKFLSYELITPIVSLQPEVQQALADLLTLDTSNLSIGEYQAQIFNALINAFPDDIDLQNKMKSLFGFDNVIEDTEVQLERLRDTFGDAVDDLSVDEIETAFELVVNGDEAITTVDELKEKIKQTQTLAATSIDLDVRTNMDAIEAALESENAGADYEKAIEYIEQAKSLFDKGLVGTDDFKSIATYLSPTGADDPVNFMENYGKAIRYLTDDASGVQNFLNDLQTKGYATLETMSDGTQQWSYDISDLQDAASDMGIGFEFMMDMFGRLEDYGFHNNFVGSVEDGAQRISELSSQLVDAESELARLESSGSNLTYDENGNAQYTLGDQTAIDQQREKVNALKNDITETQDAMDQLVARSADEYAQQVDTAKQTISSLAEERKKILDESTYGEDTQNVADLMEQEIRDIANQNGLELDSELNVKINADDEASPIIDDINKQELLDKHAELYADDEATGILNLWNSMSADPKITSLSAEDQASYVIEFWNGLTPEQKEAYINGEISITDSATGTIQTVDGEIANLNTEPTVYINSVNNASSTIQTVSSQMAMLDGKTATTYIKTIKTTQTSNASSQGGLFGQATGTMLSPAHASGTAYNVLNLKPAYANGSVSLPKDEKALVNELGNEYCRYFINK